VFLQIVFRPEDFFCSVLFCSGTVFGYSRGSVKKCRAAITVACSERNLVGGMDETGPDNETWMGKVSKK